MRNRMFLLSAAVAALGLAACNPHNDQSASAPAIGAPPPR